MQRAAHDHHGDRFAPGREHGEIGLVHNQLIVMLARCHQLQWMRRRQREERKEEEEEGAHDERVHVRLCG